jgi:NhaA family Na+:H+ antiporter
MAGTLPPLELPPTRWERLLAPWTRFVQHEASSGALLLSATALALAWANSPWGESYARLWETKVRLGVGEVEMALSLHHLVNDGLMAIFFFLVGLEIKRELLVGELASPRRAALPIAAALGGMLVPAAIYVLFNPSGPERRGWGVPMATDIAFSLGILALVGRGGPPSLRIFLAALAIVDDLGAVLVIAIFYAGKLDMTALAMAAGAFGLLLVANRLGARHPAVYAVLALALWAAVFGSGVHATVAGVLAALAVPARTRVDTHEVLHRGRALLDAFDAAGEEGPNVLTNRGQQAALEGLERLTEAALTPLQRMERALHTWVLYGIMPVFALANAGVRLDDLGAHVLGSSVLWGVTLGLALGKPLGITLAAWGATRLGWAQAPEAGWRRLHAVGWLAGIGFTMALFIATLAFPSGPALAAAKVGILSGSFVAALVGAALLVTRRRGSSA